MRIICLLLTVFLVAGCTLPPALQIASFAASGISYLTSGKSMSDHVLSTAMAQDCALHRLVMNEPVCVEGDDEFAVASIDQKRLDQVVMVHKPQTARTQPEELKAALIALANQIDEAAAPTGTVQSNAPAAANPSDTADFEQIASALDNLAPAAGPAVDGFIVVGQYRDIKTANEARRVAGTAKIRMVVAAGELWHRVIVGPMNKKAADNTFAKLTDAVPGNWHVADACENCATDGLTVALQQ